MIEPVRSGTGLDKLNKLDQRIQMIEPAEIG